MAHNLRREIDGERCDIFVGRSFSLFGTESYVSVDLVNGGISAFDATDRSLYSIIKDVIIETRKGRKVLFHQSPGVIGYGVDSIYLVPFSTERQLLISDMVNGIESGNISRQLL